MNSAKANGPAVICVTIASELHVCMTMLECIIIPEFCEWKTTFRIKRKAPRVFGGYVGAPLNSVLEEPSFKVTRRIFQDFTHFK